MLTAGKPFTRENLVSLKRADIQRLCKDYGVRANMKTEALIELLLDSIQSNMSPLVGPRPPQHAPAPRRVSTRSSTRVSSLRSRGTSGSSSSMSFAASSSNAVSNESSRTSKSKLTQHKLGVGRPSALAGLTLRATSRSSNTSKANRGRTGRSFKPPEATIVEEPEPPQPASSPDQNMGPSTSRIISSATDDDVVTRLGRLESTFREADVKHQLDSLRHVPSQVAYLKASMQQREAEIMGLRGELNVCKAEILTLRIEVSKVALLEDQLKTLRGAFDQLKTSNSNARIKVIPRVPTPFSESNTNAILDSKATSSVPNRPAATQAPQAQDNPVTPSKPQPGPSETALGKRPRGLNLNITADTAVIEEGVVAAQEEPTRRTLPDKKRARTGAERRPLQEKPIEPKPESERPAADHEPGEDCIGSVGSSASGASTHPSVSTPPLVSHPPEHLGEFSAQQEGLLSGDIDTLDFCHAASSTPRDDMFNFFDQGESFSQLSVTKLGARLAAHNPNSQQQNSSPQPIQQEPRRISTTVARPRTPPRPSGPGRFRVAVDNMSPVKEDITSSPFDPYGDGVFVMPFGTGLNAGANYGRRDVQNANQNQVLVPAPMPLALGFGLGSAAPGMMQDDSPVRPAPRTMYGTELQNDTRFGDFGRDGIATATNIDFWANF